MRVYMLQDVVTGAFYGGVSHGTTNWFPQRGAEIWMNRRQVTAIQDGLKPLYTTTLKEYTLKPCNLGVCNVTMSKLQQTKWEDNEGWQWEDGPIFLGVSGRELAIDYGHTLQRLKDLEGIASLYQDQKRCTSILGTLTNRPRGCGEVT